MGSDPTYGIYGAVLPADEPTPFEPESDEEEVEEEEGEEDEEGKDGKKKADNGDDQGGGIPADVPSSESDTQPITKPR